MTYIAIVRLYQSSVSIEPTSLTSLHPIEQSSEDLACVKRRSSDRQTHFRPSLVFTSVSSYIGQSTVKKSSDDASIPLLFDSHLNSGLTHDHVDDKQSP